VTLVGLDTNVLAYLAGIDRAPDDGHKIDAARSLVRRLAGRARFVAPYQALGELFTLLARAGASRSEARTIVVRLHHAFEGAEGTAPVFLAAVDLATDHRLQFWDSLILAAAAEAGCSLLLSEDMQHGFIWRGLTVVNPFASAPHPALATL
jgi:predicted nucleic acid-binding protein